MAVNWQRVTATRKRIIELETELASLYDHRKSLIQHMQTEGMKQREIGAYWNVSQPRIQQILK